MMESLPFLEWWLPFWCLFLLLIFTHQPFCSLTDINSYQHKFICLSGLFFWVRISNMNESLDCRPWMLVQVWGWVGGGGVGGGNGGKGGVICLCARCCSLSCQIRALHSKRCYMELHRKHSCNRLLLIYYSAARENSKDFLWPKILAISIWIDVKEKYSWGDEIQMEE